MNTINDYIKHLKSLNNSELFFDCDVKELNEIDKLKVLITNTDINCAPQIDALKILILEVKDNQEIYALDRFPNLEKLKIYCRGSLSVKVTFSFLEKLKVLSLHDIDVSSLGHLNTLPNLEVLDLRFNNLKLIKGIDSLTNLKLLDLQGNKLNTIKALEGLKNLELLNLAENNISDLSVLNDLPCLRFVNISGNDITEEDVQRQLIRPEIVIWADGPGEWYT